MKQLIAVMTSRLFPKFTERANIARNTWALDAADSGWDVRFFVGSRPEFLGLLTDDEVLLDAPDDYKGLRIKTQKMFAWAVARGYDRILKTDDDVYVIPSRLGDGFERYDYVGRVRGPSRENDAPRIYGSAEVSFCSGFGYVLSQRAAQIVAEAPDNGDWAEDRFAGQALFRAGIRPTNNPGMKLWPPLEGHLCGREHGTCPSCLAQYDGAVVVCPYDKPSVIPRMHEMFKQSGAIPTRIV